MSLPFTRPHQYILNGTEPVGCEDLMTWARWMETADRTVEETFVTHPFTGEVTRISTVFLGVDYNWSPWGPPVLFETMAFAAPEEVRLFDGPPRWVPRALPYQPRYRTWEEALAGHKKVHEDVLRSTQLEVVANVHQQEPHGSE